MILILLTPIRFETLLNVCFAFSFMLKPPRSRSETSNQKSFWLFLCCRLGTHLRVYSRSIYLYGSCRNRSITQRNRQKIILFTKTRDQHCGIEKDSTTNSSTMATAQHHNNDSSSNSSNEDYNETDERRRKFFNKNRLRNGFGYVFFK